MREKQIAEYKSQIKEIERKLHSPFSSLWSHKNEEKALEKNLTTLRLELARLYKADNQQDLALATLEIAYSQNKASELTIQLLTLLINSSDKNKALPMYLEELLPKLALSRFSADRKCLPEYLDKYVNLVPVENSLKMLEQVTASLDKNTLNDSAIYKHLLNLKICLFHDLKDFKSAFGVFCLLTDHYNTLMKSKSSPYRTSEEISAFLSAYSLACVKGIPCPKTLETSVKEILKSNSHQRYEILFDIDIQANDLELFKKIAFWYFDSKITVPQWFPPFQIQEAQIRSPKNELPLPLPKPQKQSTEEVLPLPEYERIKRVLTLDWRQYGVAGYKTEIRKAVETLFLPRALSPEQLNKTGLKVPRGAVFDGPPGTGKTLIAKTISERFFTDVVVINGPELLSKFVGESPERLRAILDKAKFRSDTQVVIIDEIDALVGSRDQVDGISNQVKADLTTTFLTYLDGIHENHNLLIIGITNYYTRLDPALIRAGRLGIHIHIGLPNFDDRLEILELYLSDLQKKNTVEKTLDLKLLARQSEGLSGASIKAFIDDSIATFGLSQITKYGPAGIELGDINEIQPISEQQLSSCLNRFLSTSMVKASEKDILFSRPFCLYNPNLHQQVRDIRLLAKEFNYSRPLLIHISGIPGSGTSSLGLHLFASNREQITYMKAGELVHLSAREQETTIHENFSKALSGKPGILIIDDLDDINACHFRPEIYLRNTLKKALPEGEKVIIILISKHEKSLDNLFNKQISCDLSLSIPLIQEKSEIFALAKMLGLNTGMGDHDLQTLKHSLTVSKIKVALLSAYNQIQPDQINIDQLVRQLNSLLHDSLENQDAMELFGLFPKKGLAATIIDDYHLNISH